LCLIIAGCSNDNGNSHDNDDNNKISYGLLTITGIPQGYVIQTGDVMNKSDIEWVSNNDYRYSSLIGRSRPQDDVYRPYQIGNLSKIEGSFNTADIYPEKFELLNGVWSSKRTERGFNYTGKGSVWVYFNTQNAKINCWGWNDVDFVEGKATVAFPTDEEMGGGTFPEPIGKLTINGIPSEYNDKYIFLGGGASDVTVLYGMTDITFTSYTDYTFHLVKITNGSAVVPLYKINTGGAASYSTIFSPYNGNGTITALVIMILNDSKLNVANAQNVTNYVASTSITSNSFSGGNLTVSSLTWIPLP